MHQGYGFPQLALLTLGLSSLAACSSSDGVLEPRLDADLQTYVVVTSAGDLLQRLEFSDVAPAPGDTLHIKSVVVNRGLLRPVESRICGMDVRGLEMDPTVACAGYSMKSDLQHGDSLVTWQSGVVRSSAGSYQVRLRHLLDPEAWVTVGLTVKRQ